MSHPSTSISSISSPLSTPSTTTSRLEVDSTAPVPPRPRVTLKKADGTEVNNENLKPSSPPANDVSTNGQASVFGQGSPRTTIPNRQSVRLETPEQRYERLAEERVEAGAEEEVKKEKEAQEHKQKELEEKTEREKEERRREKRRKKRIRKKEEKKERARQEEEEREKEAKRREEGEHQRQGEEATTRVKTVEELSRVEQIRKIPVSPPQVINESLRVNPRRPQKGLGHLGQSNTSQGSVSLPSVPAATGTMNDLSHVQYSDGVSSPNPALDPGARDGEFRYQALGSMPERLDVSYSNKNPFHFSLPQNPLYTTLPHEHDLLRPAPVIPTLSHIPLLTGKADFNSWDDAIRETLASMSLLDHIYDPSFGFVLPEGFVVAKRPERMDDPTPQDTAAFTTWWRDDQIVAHVLRSRLSPDIPAFPLGVMDAKGLYAGIYRTYSARDWRTGKALLDGTLCLRFDSRQLFDYCKRWRSAFMRIRSTRYPLPVTVAIDYFLQPIPDTVVPVSVIKSNFYETVHAIDENDPAGFLRVIESVEACANDFHDGPIMHADDLLPPPPVANNPPRFPSQTGVPVGNTAPSTNRRNAPPALTFCEADEDSPDMVDHRVRVLLNKLTLKEFDSISDQIIEWVNESEKEKDGRTLAQVTRLVFEKAIEETAWSEMYARLCRKMMEQISNKVQDGSIRNTEGKPIGGGQLFRTYLLSRCQEDFERGWDLKGATGAAAGSNTLGSEAAKMFNEMDRTGGITSEEYYAAQKARQQGLGLIKFIGELFKLQMLTERIMHECVKKLLGNVNYPEEEEIESLCMLLRTVGDRLDTQKARAHMDVYFQRMREIKKSPNVSPRMQLVLQEIIELRDRKWDTVAAPAAIVDSGRRRRRKGSSRKEVESEYF